MPDTDDMQIIFILPFFVENFKKEKLHLKRKKIIFKNKFPFS